MDNQEQKFIQMTQPPVPRLICKLAIPCIISMLITSFYNMADTFFVGMMDSTAATGAVGVVFSMMAIIQAVGFFFGHGSGNYIARELGKKNYDEACTMAATGFYSSLIAGTLICIAGQIWLDPLAYALGSSETILPYTRDYLRIILLGAPWMAGSLVLNNQLRYQGNAIYAMVGIVTGAVLNIVLDPILIFGMGLEVAGAGWATIISQFVSFYILYVGCSKDNSIRIRISNIKFRAFYFAMIIRGGLPSLARQCLASFAAICLNRAAVIHGDAVIASMGIVQRIMMFGASTMIGFGQGFQPVCGFNFGARLYDRVRQGFWFCVKFSFVFLLGVSALLFIFAPQVIALFQKNDPDVIRYGALTLRFQCLTFPLQSWIVMCNMMEQSIGRTVCATFLSAARQGVFFIPSIFILSALFGLTGIQLSQTVADFATFLCAIPIHIHVLKTMEPQHTKQHILTK